MFCSNCSVQIPKQAEICPKCGVRPFRMNYYCSDCGSKVRQENQEYCIECGFFLNKPVAGSYSQVMEPWLVALLSFLVSGLGQMVVGQVKKGATLLVGSMIIAFFTFGTSFFLTTPLVVIDGYLIGKKLKEGKRVREWEFF